MEQRKNKTVTNEKNLGVLCQWFNVTYCNTLYILEAANLNFHGLLDICKYKCHIPDARRTKISITGFGKIKRVNVFSINEKTFSAIGTLIE